MIHKFTHCPLWGCILLVCLCFWPHMLWSQNIQYTISWQGFEDPELKQVLQAVSNTAQYSDSPPASLGLLRQRVDNDLPRLRRVLEARGHFKARITSRLETDTTPVTVRFRIIPGPQFALENVRFQSQQPLPDKVAFPPPEALDLQPGRGITTEDLIRGRSLLQTYFRERGWPFVEIQKPQATANHATNAVSATYRIAPGPRLRFGELHLSGLEKVRPDYVHRKVTWEKGEWYNATQVSATERALLQSGLFTTATVESDKPPENAEAVPMRLTLHERKARTAKAGLEYTSDFALGGQLSWEHRNLFGNGERLQTQLKANSDQKQLESSLRFPAFLRSSQELVLTSDLQEEDTEAYNTRHFRNVAQVERQVTRNLRVGLGTGHEYLEQEQEGTSIFNLVSFPFFGDWDQRSDILNPTTGYRLQFHATPYQDITEAAGNFLTYKTSGSLYIPLLRQETLVWAGRAGFGQILGPADAIPTSKRFFPGGGGSIRGFAYQTAGPLDTDDTPLGGDSVVEMSSELRVKLTEKWGGTLFLDGGRAFAESEPDLDQELFWGAGIGVRYYSGIGPLRLDLATPLNPRSGVDDRLQIYFSIGQAF